MNRAVKFEDDRLRVGARVQRCRSGRALALGLVAAALSLLSCDRSKVVVQLSWDETSAVVGGKTMIEVAFTDPTLPADAQQLKAQDTTPGGTLPLKSPLTLVYWVDDPNKPIHVTINLLPSPNAPAIFTKDDTWKGKQLSWCVPGANGICTNCGGVSCSFVTDGGANDGPDAAGGRGGEAAGGKAGSGGVGGNVGAGGSVGPGGATMPATGGAGVAGMGGRPISAEGGRGGAGGKGVGGVSITPAGGSKGEGGVIGVGGSAVGGTPGVGGVGVGGSATGGNSTGGSSTGGVMGTGGVTPTGGAGGSPPPSCLTDTSVPCTCADYCDALSSPASCTVSNWNYFLPGDAPSRQDCLSSCAGFGWAPGYNVFGATNSIGCRVNQAVATACTSASPTGGRVCGLDRCSVYCDALSRNCAGTYPAGWPTDHDDCVVKCMNPPIVWNTSETLATSGATGNCLLYWAGQAGTGTATDKVTACKNADPQSLVCR